MFKKRAFVHWYLEEGLDEMEFMEAGSHASDMAIYYEMYTHYGTDDDDGEEDESEAEVATE